MDVPIPLHMGLSIISFTSYNFFFFREKEKEKVNAVRLFYAKHAVNVGLSSGSHCDLNK
jgi:hypothetical protein